MTFVFNEGVCNSIDFLYDTYKQSSLTCCTSDTSNPFSENKWKYLLVSVINSSLLLSEVCANSPQILLRQRLASARHPALNEMSSEHKVIPLWARTRLMYCFLLVCITPRRLPRCFHFYFQESVHILHK